MSGRIPVMIHLDGDTFRQLERIAAKQGTTLRALVEHGAGRIAGTITPTVQGRGHRTIDDATISEWVVAARTGVSNNAIAERYGVSKSIVSLRLRERGIRRHRRRT